MVARLSVSLKGSRSSAHGSASAVYKFRFLQDTLRKVLSGIDNPNDIIDILRPTQQAVKRKTPVDTGALQSSVFLDVRNYRGKESAIFSLGRGDPTGPRIYNFESEAYVDEYATLVHETHRTHRYFFTNTILAALPSIEAKVAVRIGDMVAVNAKSVS